MSEWSENKLGERFAFRWLMSFRFLFLSIMLTSAWILEKFYQDPASVIVRNLILWGFGFSVVSFVASQFWPQKFRWLQAWIQLTWDLGMVSYLVIASGGIFSGFTVLYFIYLLLGAFSLGIGGAIFGVGIAMLGYVVASVWGDSAAGLSDPRSISRFLLVLSSLLAVGGLVGLLLKHGERLKRLLRKTEVELKDLHALNAAVVQNSPSGIICFNLATRKLELVNPAAERILGTENLKADALSSLMATFLNGQGRREAQIKLSTGERVLGYHVVALSEQFMLIVFQDLTQIREFEEKVSLNEKLISVGQLAAGIAHEIRNPLASLSGSIQLLKNEMPKDSSNEKLMRIVLRETDRLDQLIKDFLIYAKPSKLRLETVYLKDLVDELIQLLKNAKLSEKLNLELKNLIPSEVSCCCDPAQLRQILWNLMLNAIQSIEGKGEVRVSSKVLDRGWLQLVVTDTGTGIPEHQRAKIFDPFFTTKTEGTGLGLALVYQMVRAHGGNVGVESQEANGSKFWIELQQRGPGTAVDVKVVNS